MEKIKKLLSLNLILESGQSWPIGDKTKNFIYKNTNNKTKSIETGIGFSTFIFADRGCDHTVCFPIKYVKENVQKYAKEVNISLDNVEFIVGLSQSTLPKIKKRFNFALIDGDHMFPCPMIDFYYINNLLDINGTLIIDDLQIPSVRILYDFLIVSKKWSLIQILDHERSCAFKKLDHDPHEWFGLQEYNRIKLQPLMIPEKYFEQIEYIHNNSNKKINRIDRISK